MKYIVNLNPFDVDSKSQGLTGIPVTMAGKTIEVKPTGIYQAMPEYAEGIIRNYAKRGIVSVDQKDIINDASSDVIQTRKKKDEVPKKPKNVMFTELKIGALGQYLEYIDDADKAHIQRQTERSNNGKKYDEPEPKRLKDLKKAKGLIAAEVGKLKKKLKEGKCDNFIFYQSNSPWAGYIQDFFPEIDYRDDANAVQSGIVPTDV